MTVPLYAAFALGLLLAFFWGIQSYRMGRARGRREGMEIVQAQWRDSMVEQLKSKRDPLAKAQLEALEGEDG